MKGKRAPGRWLPWGWGLFVLANWGAALDQRRVYYLLLADVGRAEPGSSRCRLSVGLADGDGRRWIGRFAGQECIQCYLIRPRLNQVAPAGFFLSAALGTGRRLLTTPKECQSVPVSRGRSWQAQSPFLLCTNGKPTRVPGRNVESAFPRDDAVASESQTL